MTFTPAVAGQFQSTVVDNVTLSKRYFLLRLSRPGGMPRPSAGQFVHVAVPEAGRFYLRRPFSVFACTDDLLDLLVVEVGAGTKAIRRLQNGDTVDFYGPLGNQFPEAPNKKVLAIGGGVGLAPLYLYRSGAAVEAAAGFRLIYGGRSREDLFLDFFQMETHGAKLSTDDGSYGFAGTVVELARRELERESADVMFSCGPTAMLKAADRLAAEKKMRHYVSLENRMGCAMGACRACVVPVRTANGSVYRTVCHDGPVFDAAELVWNELPTP